MDDRIERQLRDLARGARAEVEAGLDVEAELTTTQRHDPASVTLAREARPGDRAGTRRAGWLAVAAIAIVALTAGFWFVGGRDDSIEVASTATSGAPPTTATNTVTATPVATTVPASDPPPATTAPSAPDPSSPTSPASSLATPATSAATGTSDPPVTTVVATTAPPAPSTTEPAGSQDVPLVEWRDLRWEAASIDRRCPSGGTGCTQLEYGADGIPLTYDPTTRELTRHSTPPVTATLPAEYGDSYVVHPGTDDVVYLVVDPETPAELAVDVVAVTLAAGDAGRELGRWARVTDNVGDSELVATPAGLVNVGCCGPDEVRPAPDAEVLVPWLDLDGEPVTFDAPTFRVEVVYPTLVVHRDDPVTGTTRTWTYEPAGEWQPRGMPTLTATYDGGFLATEFGQGYSIARGYTDGSIDQIVIDDVLYVDAVDPAGRFEVADVGEIDGRSARVDPFPDGVDTWDGRAEFGEPGTGTIELPGIDEAVDAGATWATSPVEFAAAVAGSPEVNEVRTIDATRWSEGEWTVEVTTSNLFDDSVEAVRWVLVLTRGDDGRFRFESGQWSQSCQPGRGHQEFSPDLCI